MASEAEAHRCPSYSADGADLIVGAVGPGGRVGTLVPPLPVDAGRLGRLRATHGALLEERLRFSGACQSGGCTNWRDDACGVIADVLDAQPVPVRIERLPACAIRSTCQWWHEHGRSACGVCPTVVTATVG